MALNILGSVVGKVGGVTGAAAGTFAQLIVSLGSSAVEAMLAPWTREFHYSANFLTRNLVPDIAACAQANYAGLVSDVDFSNLIRWHGVRWGAGDGDATRVMGNAWEQIFELGRPRLSASQAQDAWNRGIITVAMRDERLAFDGLRPEDAFAIKQDIAIPSVAWAVDQLYLNAISQDQYDYIVDRNGWATSQYRPLLGLLADPLSPQVALAFDWRGIWDGDKVDRHLRAAVCHSNIDVAQYRRATRPIPTPTQAVGLVRSGAYDVDIVTRWGLDDEEEGLVAQLSHLSGWDYPQPIQLPDGTLADGVEYPTLFWREHWSLFGMGQALDAWHRLAPRYYQRFAAVAPGITAFGNDHLTDAMKKAAVPPGARQWALALSFQEIPIGTIQVLYTYGKRDRAWAIDALALHKYDAGNASAIVEGWDTQLAEGRFAPQRAAATRSITESIKRTVEAYADGFISQTDAHMALIADGIQADTAELLLTNANLAERHKQVAAVVRRIRTDWMEGALDDLQASANLGLAGIQGWRINSYLVQWTAERNLTARVATSNQVIRWAAEGLLTPLQAQTRLVNLGWQAPDVALQLAEIQGRVIRAQAASVAARARSARAQVAALARAQQQAAAVISRSQSAARRALPLGTLHSWFLRGEVGESYVRNKLAVSGYDQATIDEYLKNWKLEQSDYVAPGVAGTLAEKLKLPTVAQIQKWAKDKIIDAAEAEAELQGLGLSHDDIKHFLDQWGLSAPIP